MKLWMKVNHNAFKAYQLGLNNYLSYIKDSGFFLDEKAAASREFEGSHG